MTTLETKDNRREPKISKAQTLTFERASELIHYDPITGLCSWKVDRRAGARAGEKAGSVNKAGYEIITIDDVNHPTHRLAFLLMNGSFPKKTVDHINRVRNDNRWDNLREATRTQQQLNRVQKLDASGYRGVTRRGKSSWAAHIRHGDDLKHLGTFKSPEAAAQAVKDAELFFRGDDIHFNDPNWVDPELEEATLAFMELDSAQDPP